MIQDECGCYYDDEEDFTPKPSLWRRFKAKVRSTFQGPPGYPGPQGPQGDDGAPGHLQLSGFPHGTKICLYGAVGELLWSGELSREDK